jgi:hypothetical protein
MYVDYYAMFNIDNQPHEIQIYRFSGDLTSTSANTVVKELKNYVIDTYTGNIQNKLLSLITKQDFTIRGSEGSLYYMPGAVERSVELSIVPNPTEPTNLLQEKDYLIGIDNLDLKELLDKRKLLLNDLIIIKQKCEELESQLIKVDQTIRPKIEKHKNDVLTKQAEIDKHYAELKEAKQRLEQEIELIDKWEVAV